MTGRWLCDECWRLAVLSAAPAAMIGWLIGLLGAWLGKLGG